MRYFLILVFVGFFSAPLLAQSELQLAEQYYQKEEYEKALSYLEGIRNYDMRRVYVLTLNCYLELEEYRKAERHIKDYIKNSRSQQFDYYADLAYLFEKTGQDKEAEKLMEEILEKVNRNPGLAYGFGKAFQEQGYPQNALRVYQEAESRSKSVNFDYQKALLYGELGDIRKMYETYVEMVAGRPDYLPTVKQLLGRAIMEDDDSENSEYLTQLLIRKIQQGGPESLNELLVFVFIKEKNLSGAFTQLKALDKRNPGNKAELFNLGKVAMNNQDYLLARRIFAYIIDAGSEFPFYEAALKQDLKAEKLRLLANSASEEQWEKLADEYYKVQKKLEGQPELADLTMELAEITAFQLNDPDTAIGMLSQLIETGYIGPEDQARAKIMLGDVLLYDGQRWDAIIYYTQAEKAFEQSPIGQEAKFKRAKAAYYVGDFQWAQGIFNALKASTSKLIANDALYYSILITDNIALDTNTEAMAMFAKADLLAYRQLADSALQVLNMMDIAFPDHKIQDEVLLLKARIQKGQGHYEEAATSLQDLLTYYGDDILADDALYELAQLYENQLGKPQEAQEMYQRIFTEHPDSFYASDARKRFRLLRGDVVN